MLCPIGRYAEQDTTAEPCRPCKPGTYAGSPGLTACVSCSPGFVAPLDGMGSCYQCPEDSVVLGSIRCLCKIGYFGNESADASGVASRCDLCPEGSVCTQPGQTWQKLPIAPGYWRETNRSDFIKCLIPTDCQGGNVTVQCSANRAGPVCGTCLPGTSGARPRCGASFLNSGLI